MVWYWCVGQFVINNHKYICDFFVASARRKSNCVKEVERIKQRREVRRAAHQAIREQHETVYDTSRPNWEFESMIQ